MDTDCDLEEILIANIQLHLPHLSHDKTVQLTYYLVQKGVKKLVDLRHMTIPILENQLDTVDSSDLYVAWQNSYGSSHVQQSAGNSTISSSLSKGPVAETRVRSVSEAGPSSSRGILSPVISEELQSNARAVLTPKLPEYDKDSPFIPAAVRKAINDKKRPTEGIESMVERIVDDCREKVPGLQRCMFNTVAESLVSKYPDTFKDTVPISSHGSDGLAKQMKIKFDNVRRPRSLTRKEKEAPSCNEAYGCVGWNPELPENETEESQEQLRVLLSQMFKLSKKEWNWKNIKKLMEDAYYLQRKEINGALASIIVREGRKKRKRSAVETDEEAGEDEESPVNIQTLQVRWPFLFQVRGINVHFKILTGVDIGDDLKEFVRTESADFIEYLACKSEELAAMRRSMIRAEKLYPQCDSKLVATLLMLLNHFKEDKAAIVVFVEPTTNLEDAQTSADLPEGKTPVIVAAGTTLYNARKFFISIDNHLVGTAASLQDAVCMVFAAYFVFNIEFATKAACLLTFLQRVVAKINPARGSKCTTAIVQKRANERINRFMNKFAQYKQMLADEEKENQV